MKRGRIDDDIVDGLILDDVSIIRIDASDNGDRGDTILQLSSCTCGFFESVCQILSVERLADLLNEVRSGSNVWA